MKRSSGRRGFTLVELLCVFAALCILAGAAALAFGEADERRIVREEAEEKPPDVPGMESGEAGGIHAEGPPQAERAGGGMARDPAGGTAASPKQGPAAKQGALAGDRQEPAAKQGALAGAERQEALADAERQEALLCAKEALLRLRQAGVSAAEAHALIKQLFGEAEKGEKR